MRRVRRCRSGNGIDATIKSWHDEREVGARCNRLLAASAMPSTDVIEPYFALDSQLPRSFIMCDRLALPS